MTYELLQECLKDHSVSDIAKKLNIVNGTINRWILLRSVPLNYTFDLHKVLGRDIDYTDFTYKQKDQFFTPNDMAEKCWKKFNEIVTTDINDYTFIEPSAGDGSFMKVLPKNTIGIDIEPRYPGVIKHDYLTWKPDDLNQKYIVFGNPPFGLRGHLALNFINHSYDFSDYVCLILPQLFESDGKGSPRKRVSKYNLIFSEKVTGLFHSPDGERTKVNGVFQIWSKYTENPEYAIREMDDTHLKIYSMSDGGTVSSTRNKNMIGKCHIYLPSTCFGKENMKVYTSFEDLPGRRGYGIIFNKDVDGMIKKANTIKWHEVSFMSTNSAYNLRTSSIHKSLIQAVQL